MQRRWVGVDLGSAQHQVCVLDEERRVLLEQTVAHEGKATRELVQSLLRLAGGEAEALHVALETPSSAVAESLLEQGMRVYSLNPKQLDRFRDRHTVAGAKDDRRDAFVLADSLRTDTHLYKPLKLGPSQVVELRSLSRIYDELSAEHNALANRIDAEVLRCFPELRTLGSLHTDGWMLDLLELGCIPTHAKKVRKDRVASVLKTGRVKKVTLEHALRVLRGGSQYVAPGVAEACKRHVDMLIPRLRLIRVQQKQCRRDMQRLLDALSEPEPDSKRQRDAAIVQSLAGSGTIVSATLLAEAWQPLADRDYSGLRALCGAAPVTIRSGKSTKVVMRRACNGRLRQAVFHLAFCGLQKDPRSKQQYAALRARGHSHGRALRGVADRVLELLVRLLRSHQLYDLERRTIVAT